MALGTVNTELVALVAAVVETTPMVLTVGSGDGLRLPAGPLESHHGSMQEGLRCWVDAQTGHHLGYAEQLYTFADPGRSADTDRVISVSYLGLTRSRSEGQWAPWYDFFPWEDHRTAPNGHGGPAPQHHARQIIDTLITPSLRGWIQATPESHRARRRLRAEVCFGLDGRPWAPELALQRYELLYEVGLIPESPNSCTIDEALPGRSMAADHRRILATGLTRLRSKIQYRPVVFELLSTSFTLGGLQATVEALAGQPLHKQNFRRLVVQQELVEPTGAVDGETGGRPAQLFRFRRDVVDDWHVAGTRLPRPR